MVKISTRQELQNELTKSKSALVLFYASWCGFCRRFLPSFEEQMSKQKFENVIYMLIDDLDSPLWDEYNIEAVPTVIYFEESKVSKRLDARSGRGLTEGELISWLQEFEK